MSSARLRQFKKKVPVVWLLYFQSFGGPHGYVMKPLFSQTYFSIYFQVSACVEKNWTLCCAGLLFFQTGLGVASFSMLSHSELGAVFL